MVPEPLVQQFKKKRWGSGDENENSQESLLTQEVKEYKVNKIVTLGLSVIT